MLGCIPSRIVIDERDRVRSKAPADPRRCRLIYPATHIPVHIEAFDRAAGAAYVCLLGVPECALGRAGVDRVDEVNLLTKSIKSISTG